MIHKKNIFAIIGSASSNSSNLKIVEKLASMTVDAFDFTIYNDLKLLPHFDPERSASNPPNEIIALRKNIEQADGILICTPEYVFSIPSGLKNAIEWCIATTVFTDKPAGIITASAAGEKGHEELQLILSTAMAKFTPKTTLLIQGVKGKVNEHGEITDESIITDLTTFIAAFETLMKQ